MSLHPNSYSVQERVDEFRKALRMLCEFAYEQGFHEMGYDPLKAFEDALRDETKGAVDLLSKVYHSWALHGIAPELEAEIERVLRSTPHATSERPA